MVWIIVAVGLLAAFGPIFWLMPSRRDRRLAKLREAARRRGLAVELTQVPLLDPTPEERVSAGGVRRPGTQPCAAYRRPMPPGCEDAPGWFLLRGEGQDGPLDGWASHPHQQPQRLPSDADGYWRDVAQAMQGIETPVLAIEATPAAVSWYWREDAPPEALDDALDEIATRLAAIAALHADIGDKAE